MVTDLQLVEGVRGLVSLFSARQAPEPGKLPAALFPERSSEGRGLRQVQSRPSTATRSSAASCCRRTARWR